MPKLAHSLNRPIFVAIPDLFADDEARRCILVDIEEAGLWLRSDSMDTALSDLEEITSQMRTLTDVFVPFERILFAVDPSQAAFLAKRLSLREVRSSNDTSHKAPSGSHQQTSSKHKGSKRTR